MGGNSWFRMYSEFANDPKVQSMAENMQRRLAMLFCLRCGDVLRTLGEAEIAFALRISDGELAETKALFLSKGFISEDWEIANWDKRQFVSDSSTERTRKYRSKKGTSRKRHSDALDTEQIQNREEVAATAAPTSAPGPVLVKPYAASESEESRARIDDWNQPDIQELAKNLVRDLQENHPVPSNAQTAERAAQEELLAWSDPWGRAEELRKRHSEHRLYWADQRKADPSYRIPQLTYWFVDGICRQKALLPDNQRGPQKNYSTHGSLALKKQPEYQDL